MVRVLSPRGDARLDPSVEFTHGRIELGTDLDAVLTGCTAVVDAASSAVPKTVQASPASFFASGVANSAWLAERAVANNVTVVLYLSSGGTVYSGQPSSARGYSEQDFPTPVGSYGGLKYATEVAVRSITRETRTRSVMLRVANAYGPGQNLSRPQGIIGVAWRNHLSGLPTVLYGASEIVRDYVYVDDVARLCALAISSGYDGVLNAGSGEGCSLAQLVGIMEDVCGEKISVTHAARRSFDVPQSILDVSLAKKLGWTAEVGLRQGLESTWHWMNAST